MNTSFEKSPSRSPRFRGELLNQIYRVWFVRRFLPVIIAEVVVLSALLYFLARAVFVRQIIENALGVFFASPPHLLSFVIFAFLYASVAVKIMGFTLLLLLAFFIRSIVQGILRWILVRQNYFGRIETKGTQ